MHSLSTRVEKYSNRDQKQNYLDQTVTSMVMMLLAMELKLKEIHSWNSAGGTNVLLETLHGTALLQEASIVKQVTITEQGYEYDIC